MAEANTFAPGNYRFVPGPFQYSGGAAAEPGYAIVRARFADPVPLVRGFEIVARTIKAAGRPLTALCACELRSPGQFSDDGFRAFNRTYVGTLAEWGIFDGTTNPVARSNVCPVLAAPSEPSFHAFAFTVPDGRGTPSFAIAGSGEAPEGPGPYAERIVRLGDATTAGLREKARFVLGEMERRMGLLGCGWHDTTATQIYCVHDIHPLLETEIVPRGAARHGLTWHFCRPPVVGLDYEMDCRGVADERVLSDGV